MKRSSRSPPTGGSTGCRPVDRTILRIGLWELRHDAGTSVGTIIDEAVELAKRYSTEQSGRFVNGVLATWRRGNAPLRPPEASTPAGRMPYPTG